MSATLVATPYNTSRADPCSGSRNGNSLISAALYPLAPATRSCYGARLWHLMDWLEVNGGALDRATIDLYLASLPVTISSYNQTVSAIKRLAQTAQDQGLLPAADAARLATLRLKSLRGNRIGTWLNLEAAEELLRAPDRTTLRGKRDSVVLGLMIGAGLRRSEVASVSVDQFVVRDGRPVLLDVLGKGSRIRTIALPGWTAQWIQDWLECSAICSTNDVRSGKCTADCSTNGGRLVRSISRHGTIGLGLSSVAVWDIVATYTKIDTAMIVDQHEARSADRVVNQGHVRPHDLRRTFAKLSRKGGAKLEDLQLALGHASITTTMRYVGQDLSVAACDSLQINPYL